MPFDAWGRRVDHIEVAAGWTGLDAVAAQEALVAGPYEAQGGEARADARIVQAARLFLYAPSSAIHICPLAMTDGAARLLEVHGRSTLEHVAAHLTSRDPATFWTSGQWMTERGGGSDVAAATLTQAEPVAGEPEEARDAWRLTGDKWFTSATTSQVAFTLAVAPGDRGPSVFCVRLRDGDGALRGIRIHRLKDKLGTRALPTAELSLEGTPATLVGERGRGIATIAVLFNVTRIYNALSAAGLLSRAVMLATDYADRREAFGRPLAELPLHGATLESLELERTTAMLLAFETARLQGRHEGGLATAQEEAVLRLLTPVAKLMTAKQAVAGISEALECFGGAGYVEDTGLPRLLRDAQVLPIWEGTTNVLSLDVLRAIRGDGLWQQFASWVDGHLEPPGVDLAPDARLDEAGVCLRHGLRAATQWLEAMRTEGRAAMEAGARRFAVLLGRISAGVLLVDLARQAASDSSVDYAARCTAWCEQVDEASRALLRHASTDREPPVPNAGVAATR